jgi:hypothetical protein
VVATEFAAKFFQPVVVNIHLFTDAKDNRSTNEERQNHTTLIQKLGPKGKLKDIYFTALYNYGNDTTYMQQLQQQLPECVVLNTKTSDFPQTIQQLDEQRKTQIEQVSVRNFDKITNCAICFFVFFQNSVSIYKQTKNQFSLLLEIKSYKWSCNLYRVFGKIKSFLGWTYS